MTPDTTALWLLSGIVVPRYVRARRAARRTRRIPAYVLRQYHQSDAWRARKTAYNRHPKVCVACLWLMPVAFWGWCLRLFFVWYPPLRRLIKRLFKRNSLELHHVSYASIWDGEMLHPGAEKDRHLMRLCTTIPIASRLCDGCSHHAAADRVRRFCERTGLPPVLMTRLWVAKCWVVQSALATILLLWLSH